MKVDVKKLPNSRVELTIEQPTADVAKSRKQVIESASKNADIKGFRKGATIPEDVIVRQFGEDVINQMTIEKAIEKVYQDTLRKEKLLPVSQAEIKEVISQDPLKVKIEVEVLPTVEMKKGYRDIKLKKPKITVTDTEVQEALDDIQTRFTHFHPADADYAAQMGDRIVIDTDGYDADGNVLESTSMRSYPIVLGGNILVPGFEEDMVGMKAGDEKDIDVTFPKDYHNSEFAGKKLKFHVTVHSVEKSHVPEFDEDFIEKLRGKKLDLAGFKKLIKEEIKETKTANAQVEQEVQLIDELLKYTDVEIWDTLLAQQIGQTYNEIKENVSRDGIQMSDYLASLGLSEEEYKAQHITDTAKKRLQWELILNQLVDDESVEVSDKKMDEEIEKIMSRFESEEVRDRLKDMYVAGSRQYEELRRRAAFRELIDSFYTAETAKK